MGLESDRLADLFILIEIWAIEIVNGQPVRLIGMEHVFKEHPRFFLVEQAFALFVDDQSIVVYDALVFPIYCLITPEASAYHSINKIIKRKIKVHTTSTELNKDL